MLSTERKYPVLTRLVIAYVSFVALWLLLRVLFFDRLWPLALLNTVAEYLFIPLPLLLITSVWQRRWSLLLKLGIPVIAFVVLFGELFWPPRRSSVDGDTQIITVMSFNVLYKNEEYQSIIRSIQSASPDIAGFQELRQGSAKAIASALERVF